MGAALKSDALAPELAKILKAPQAPDNITAWPEVAHRLYDAWEEKAFDALEQTASPARA